MAYSGRIGAAVRRALIAAAKTGTVVVAIDASGCEGCSSDCSSAALPCDEQCLYPPTGGSGGKYMPCGSPGTGGRSDIDACAAYPLPDARADGPARDAGTMRDASLDSAGRTGGRRDASTGTRVHDAGKDR